jgi:hypothetical protein
MIKGMIAVNDNVTYRVSTNPRFRPDSSSVEAALKSPEAAAILGENATVRVTGRGSFIEVVVSGRAPLLSEQLAELEKAVVSFVSKKGPANP